MALMDLMGLGADKQAVVLDIGTEFTKVGFAGEHAPRHIIRTEIKKMINGELRSVKLFDKPNPNDSEAFCLYKEFFHMLYFKYLLVNPKERRVVICESMLKPIHIRNTIARVLFRHFEVVSIVFIPNHLLALFAVGIQTGLVIDCGYAETTVVPIYEQIPILTAMEYIDLAGKAVHESINKHITENAIVEIKGEEKSAKSNLNLFESVLEDIKVRCCFVGRHATDLVAVPVRYPLGGDKVLHIDGKLRAHAMDMLFEGNEEDQSIVTVVLDAILKCPIDCRKELMQNIVLIGGSVMSPGFDSRLFAELKFLLSSDSYNNRLFVKKITFRNSPVPANYCAWQGGALFGALEILGDHSISRERYHVDPNIPDWSSVLSLNKEDVSKSLLDDKYKWTSLRKSLSTSSPSTVPPSTSGGSLSERLKKELGLSK